MRYIYVHLWRIFPNGGASEQREDRYSTECHDEISRVPELLCLLRRADQPGLRDHVFHTVHVRIYEVYYHGGDLQSRRALRYAYVRIFGHTNVATEQFGE